jgi:hypothetical protein
MHTLTGEYPNREASADIFVEKIAKVKRDTHTSTTSYCATEQRTGVTLWMVQRASMVVSMAP